MKLDKQKPVSGQLGGFIKELRRQKGLTQAQFAKLLETSQSAVARIERGGQNLTTKEIVKIGRVLNRNIIDLSGSLDFEVTGGHKLSGHIKTNYSKNGSVSLLCASLLNRGKTILHGIARIEEVYRLIEVLESLGVAVKWTDVNTVEIQPPVELNWSRFNNQAAAKTRSALMLVGSLLSWTNDFCLPHAGGCKMGERTITAHKLGLAGLGVKIKTTENEYRVSYKKLKDRADIVMYEAGDTAVNNILLAAATRLGPTIIRFAPANYQVQELCFFLNKLGVKIEGIGTTTLVVYGRTDDVKQTLEYTNSEDPIESMMFITTAAITGSELKITRCPLDFLRLELFKLKLMGLKFSLSKEYLAENGRTILTDIKVKPSKLKALSDKIHALPYPGINVDNLPFFVPLATQAAGTTLIHDWMWENRAIYFTELNRLGAQVKLADPHRVFINGPTKLTSAQVVCPPALRPAVIILIAMLAADGVSVLRNVYSINRGYEEIAERLNSIGAKIKVLS
ncbi:MAG: helix-turn-helix domain-containing protein [Patescibacteria group bacterium]